MVHGELRMVDGSRTSVEWTQVFSCGPSELRRARVADTVHTLGALHKDIVLFERCHARI